MIALDPSIDGSIDIACPSTSQCTSVGDGAEETFDPGSRRKKVAAISLADISGDVQHVACPSTSQCTEVNDQGEEDTFDPTSPGSASSVTIDAEINNELQGVSCPSTSMCLAGDLDGSVLQGDPTAAGAWTVDPIDSNSSIDSVFCNSVSECVAADQDGNAFVGADSPVTPSPPTTAQLNALLRPTLTTQGNAGKIPALLDHDGYSLSFTSQSGGQLVINWHQAPKGALVASATIAFYKPATTQFKIRLTAKGQRLLEDAHRLTLNGRSTFRIGSQTASSVTHTFTLTR